MAHKRILKGELVTLEAIDAGVKAVLSQHGIEWRITPTETVVWPIVWVALEAAMPVAADLGKADWQYDAEDDLHLPCCSRWKLNEAGNVVKCGNGPLGASEIPEGTCRRGPHVDPKRGETS